MHHLAIKFWWENNSRLNYMHHNIKCKVKLGVWDINFRGKYKVIINIMKHLKWEVLISPKQFWYLWKYYFNWKGYKQKSIEGVQQN